MEYPKITPEEFNGLESAFTRKMNKSNTPTKMYSIDCPHYDKEFITLTLLLEDIQLSGQDPNYKITYNGERTNETVWDLIGPQI